MKVLGFTYTPIFLRRANTDRAYMAQLHRLQDNSPIVLRSPESRVCDVIETGRSVARALRHRLHLPLNRNGDLLTGLQEHILNDLRQREGWDVFYSNSRVPRGSGLGPIVRFDYIHEPAKTENPDAFARDVASKTAIAESCTLIQVSTMSQKRLFRSIGVPDEKLHVVPFYMPDLSAISESAAREKQASTDMLRIAFVGHEAQRKGIEALLEALRDPCLKRLPLRLTIVSRFLDGAPNLPDDPRIRHYTEMPNAEVLKLFAESHVLAVPSHRETFGLVYLEGMASGCVCLMASGPQQHDISDAGKAGLPIGPDPKTLAQELLRLNDDPTYRENLAVAGLRRFENSYAPVVVAEAYTRMFHTARDEAQ